MNFKGLFFVIAGLMLIMTSSANAQSARQAMKACKADFERYCWEVKPGRGRIAACLARNEHRLNSRCKTVVQSSRAALKALYRHKEYIKAVVSSCVRDSDRFCSHIRPGGGKILSCLGRNEPRLSSPCRGAVQTAKRKIRQYYAHSDY